jgi:GNAT superfamily N-acetyltransferase
MDCVQTQDFEVALSDPHAPEALALVGAMEQEIEETYADRSGSVHTVGATPEEMSPPDGAFVIIRSEGRAVGGGGLKRLDAEACEIKRMYLVPQVRGQGLSRVLLTALEDRARELGYSIARLDTADRQVAAQRLYEGAGYRSIPKYNANDLATLWYEKEL